MSSGLGARTQPGSPPGGRCGGLGVRARQCVAIVSKDEDFHQLSFLHGPPPKVVWVRLGNCTTSDIEHLLRRSQGDMAQFDAGETGAFLIVGAKVL